MQNPYYSLLNSLYGYRFIPMAPKFKKSEKERKGIKRMKRLVRNTGTLGFERIIFTNSLDSKKTVKVLKNVLKNY
jgi:hypothetical protein